MQKKEIEQMEITGWSLICFGGKGFLKPAADHSSASLASHTFTAYHY